MQESLRNDKKDADDSLADLPTLVGGLRLTRPPGSLNLPLAGQMLG